jgi:hypothetical protein
MKLVAQWFVWCLVYLRSYVQFLALSLFFEILFQFIDFPIHNMNIFFNFLITTNLLKRHGVVGQIAANLTNRRSVLGFNIHQCTSVTKNQNMLKNRDEFNKSSQTQCL